MPYVRKSIRDDLRPEVDALLAKIKAYPYGTRKGIVNYCLTKLVCGSLVAGLTRSYELLQDAYGVYHASAAEFYRRLLAPHEDLAIDKNGDIEEYES